MRATTAGLTIQAVEGAPSGPVTLTGPPRAIRGQLRLGNDGTERVAVRGFAVRAQSVELSQGRGTLRARLEPGVSSDLDATLSLARTTPPGDYQVRLDFDGQEVDALVRVDADPSLRVTPSMVLAGPGTTSVHLEVTNTGNVSLDLPAVARSRLFADADIAPPLFGGGTSGTPTELDAVLRLKRSLSLAPGAKEQLESPSTCLRDSTPNGDTSQSFPCPRPRSAWSCRPARRRRRRSGVRQQQPGGTMHQGPSRSPAPPA